MKNERTEWCFAVLWIQIYWIRIQGFDDQKETQKRSSSSSKMYRNLLTFIFLWVIFAFLDPNPNPGTPLNPDQIQIQIQNTGFLNKN